MCVSDADVEPDNWSNAPNSQVEAYVSIACWYICSVQSSTKLLNDYKESEKNFKYYNK